MRAFTIYGHWVTVENAHLLRLVAQFGKHGDLSLTAHFPGPSWLHSREGRLWAGTSRTYWPHVLQLCSAEGYRTSGSVPHRTLRLGPETSALPTVLSLPCISSSDQLVCNENRKPEGQAHSKGSIAAHCERQARRVLRTHWHRPHPRGGVEGSRACRFPLFAFLFSLFYMEILPYGEHLHLGCEPNNHTTG